MSSTPPPEPARGPSGPPDPNAPRPVSGQPFWAWLRGLGVTRSSERWVGGVAGGVAARWGVDPLVVRGLLAATVLLGGIGFVLYAVAWALLPEPDGRIHAEQVLRGHVDQAVAGIVLLAIAGFGPASWIGFGDGGGWAAGKAVGWIALIVVVIWFVRRGGWSGSWGNGSTNRTPGSTSTGSTPGSAPGEGDPTVSQWGSASTSPAPSASDISSPYTAAAAFGTSYTSTSDAPVVEPTADPSAAKVAAIQERLARKEAAREARLSEKLATKQAAARAKPAGPGGITVAVVVALALLTVAGLLLAGRAGYVETAGWALAIGIVLVLLGAGITVSGLRGRTSGALGFFAIVGLVLAPSAFAGSQGWDWSWDGVGVFGEVQVAPTTRADAEAGVQVGAGQTNVDLTGVPLNASTLTVPISVGAGDVVITVPEGASVQADIDMFAGEVTWQVGDQDETAKGRIAENLTYTTAADGEQPQLLLDLRVGAGEVTIEESAS